MHGNRSDETNSQTSRGAPDLENLTVSQVSTLSQASLQRQPDSPKSRTIELLKNSTAEQTARGKRER